MIILLNGASSSGKSTLAKELIKILDEHYKTISINTFVDKEIRKIEQSCPEILIKSFQTILRMNYLHMLKLDWNNPLYQTIFNSISKFLEQIWKNAIESMSKYIVQQIHENNNLIVEHTTALLGEYENLIKRLRSYNNIIYVKVYCDLQVLKQREKNRPERPTGWATTHENKTHQLFDKNNMYNIKINTSTHSALESAMEIKNFIKLFKGS